MQKRARYDPLSVCGVGAVGGRTKVTPRPGTCRNAAAAIFGRNPIAVDCGTKLPLTRLQLPFLREAGG